MKMIDKLGREFPAVDAVKMQLILNHQAYPHFCIRELADLIGVAEKAAQYHIQMMNEKGKPGRASLALLTCSRDSLDKRKYKIKLTPRGEHLAALISELYNEEE